MDIGDGPFDNVTKRTVSNGIFVLLFHMLLIHGNKEKFDDEH